MVRIHISKLKNFLIEQDLFDVSISHVAYQRRFLFFMVFIDFASFLLQIVNLPFSFIIAEMKLTFDDLVTMQSKKKKRLGPPPKAKPSKRKKTMTSSPPQPRSKSPKVVVVVEGPRHEILDVSLEVC